MKTAKLAMAGSMLALLLFGFAMAATPAASDLQQPTAVEQTAYEYDNYLYFYQEEAAEEAAPEAAPDASKSPSDMPTPPAVQEEAVEQAEPIEEYCDSCNSCCGGSCAVGCGAGCGGGGGCFTVGGWIDQGITWNPDSPADRFNGPVTYNDRSNEYQMNQLYVYAERKTRTGGCGWDIGGRVDFLYGTDSRFVLANGLDDDWDSSRFYGLAMPQLYVDVAHGDLTVRIGHFYTILGYESAMAVENFFYSHSYTFQYLEPRTHTGVLAMYDLDCSWSVSGGVTRGINQWEDDNNDLDFLGGVKWTSCDRCTTAAFSINTGPADDAGDMDVTVYSFVFTHQLDRCTQLVLQHNLGVADDIPNVGDGEAYSVVVNLFRKLNSCWTAGVRYEWYRLDDSNLLAGAGDGRTWPQGLVPETLQSVAFGVKYTPCCNVIWRAECRYDWDDPDDGFPYAFDDLSDSNQVLLATDLILTF